MREAAPRPASSDPEAEGWERRFTVDRRRGEEAAALFAELGFDTRLEEARGLGSEEVCAACHAAAGPSLVTVYTRRKGVPAAERARRGPPKEG